MSFLSLFYRCLNTLQTPFQYRGFGSLNFSRILLHTPPSPIGVSCSVSVAPRYRSLNVRSISGILNSSHPSLPVRSIVKNLP